MTKSSIWQGYGNVKGLALYGASPLKAKNRFYKPFHSRKLPASYMRQKDDYGNYTAYAQYKAQYQGDKTYGTPVYPELVYGIDYASHNEIYKAAARKHDACNTADNDEYSGETCRGDVINSPAAAHAPEACVGKVGKHKR